MTKTENTVYIVYIRILTLPIQEIANLKYTDRRYVFVQVCRMKHN
jgi:hypothetical protein